MHKQKKDIYYKTEKYKLKYLQLKQQFRQFGGNPVCSSDLYDPNDLIKSPKLLTIEKSIIL